jgi:hypothetical protein
MFFFIRSLITGNLPQKGKNEFLSTADTRHDNTGKSVVISVEIDQKMQVTEYQNI